MVILIIVIQIMVNYVHEVLFTQLSFSGIIGAWTSSIFRKYKEMLSQ